MCCTGINHDLMGYSRLLSIILELEERTGSSELRRNKITLWGHATNPNYNLAEGVDNILYLRQPRPATPARRSFDKREIAKRGENYDKKLRISWITSI